MSYPARAEGLVNRIYLSIYLSIAVCLFVRSLFFFCFFFCHFFLSPSVFVFRNSLSRPNQPINILLASPKFLGFISSFPCQFHFSFNQNVITSVHYICDFAFIYPTFTVSLLSLFLVSNSNRNLFLGSHFYSVTWLIWNAMANSGKLRQCINIRNKLIGEEEIKGQYSPFVDQ